MPTTRSTRSAAAALLALLLAGPALGAVVAPAPESPFPEGSYHGLVEEVGRAEAGEYRRVLAEFDAYLKRRPDDSTAAVERCRFADAFAGDEDEGGIDGAGEDAESCRQALQQGPLAATPPVKLYLLQRQFGKAAIARGEALLPESATWTPAQRARLHEFLAARYRQQDPLKSGEHALLAVELDPASAQRLNAAEYLYRIGAQPKAVAMLEGTPPQQWQSWTLRSAISSLLDMGEPRAAQRLSQVRTDLRLDPAIRLRLARALLDAGEEEQARASINALLQGPEAKSLAGVAQLRELFEFQRDHGVRDDAIAAYRRLCQAGKTADPYGRYRLSLLWRYPAAPWHADEWRGAFGLLALMAVLALMPLLVVVPLHYRAAVKRARGLALPPPLPESPWGLGHLWYALAATLICGVLGLYLYAYPQFERMLRQSLPQSGAVADAGGLARAYLFSKLALAAALLPLLRRVQLRKLLLGHWPVGQSIGAGVGAAVAVIAAGAVIARVLQIPGPALPQTPGIALGSDTIRAMQGIHALYGPVALLLFAAVLTPLVEELVFRGVFLRVAARNVHLWLAAAAQAAVFVLDHDQPGAYALLSLMALAAAWLAWRSGGLLAALVLHGVNNAFASMAVMGITHSINTAP